MVSTSQSPSHTRLLYRLDDLVLFENYFEKYFVESARLGGRCCVSSGCR